MTLGDVKSDSHSIKLEQRTQIFVKLSFRELCGSKLPGLHPFDNLVIIQWVKNRLKMERQAMSSWDTNPWSNFVTLTENSYAIKNDTQGARNNCRDTLPHFHAKTIPEILHADRKASWSLLPSLFSLLSGRGVQPENTIPVSSRWQVRSRKNKKG